MVAQARQRFRGLDPNLRSCARIWGLRQSRGVPGAPRSVWVVSVWVRQDTVQAGMLWLIGMRIEIEQEEDGRWLTEIPDLPGVLAYGANARGLGWRG